MGFKRIYQISNTKMATGASQVKEKSEANQRVCAIERLQTFSSRGMLPYRNASLLPVLLHIFLEKPEIWVLCKSSYF